MTHHGALVKWIGADGGWKTGHVVAPDGWPVVRVTGLPEKLTAMTLVQHSCTGEIEWVDSDKLLDWQPRSEWERD